MRILILSFTLNNGGAERVVTTWANGLLSNGHEVAIYSDFSEPCTYSTDPSIRRYSSPHWNVDSRWKKVLRSMRTVRTLYSTIHDFKPDVVISSVHAFVPELMSIRYLLPKFKLLSTEHSSFERPASIPFTRSDYIKKFKLNKRYDGVTVLTSSDKIIAQKAGIKNVHMLHNPLFTEPLDYIPEKEKIVLAVGRIKEWHIKGFDILIRAWLRIADQHPDWKLRIVGSSTPQSMAYMQSLSGDCPTIEFKDYTASILDEYRQASIFCLSSRYEGWGLVLVEAMSQHCACVACDFKGRQAEIITDGKDGILCPTDDDEALAKHLDILIKDDDKRHALQLAAADNLSQYSPQIVTAHLETILKGL